MQSKSKDNSYKNVAAKVKSLKAQITRLPRVVCRLANSWTTGKLVYLSVYYFLLLSSFRSDLVVLSVLNYNANQYFLYVLCKKTVRVISSNSIPNIPNPVCQETTPRLVSRQHINT